MLKTHKLMFIFIMIVGAYTFVVFHHKNILFDYVLIYQSWIKSIPVYLNPSNERIFHLEKNFLYKSKHLATSKIILLWGSHFGDIIEDPFECPGCIITSDQSSIRKSDAVVFHFAETRDSVFSLPVTDRTSKQRWVWYCTEPPWVVRNLFQKTLTPLNGVFNWTMTYRTDSSVLASYSKEYAPIKKTVDQVIAEKTAKSLGVWMVSNCAPQKRREVIDELSKHISIDIFGHCVKRSVCSSPECLNFISRYKFYFAFENSQCKDYISEKFWTNALGFKAVPVVMGTTRQEYELVAPPNSFIHFDDFASIAKLAQYLKVLDQNDTLYGEYFRWRYTTKSKGYKSYKFSKDELRIKNNHRALYESWRNSNIQGFCGLCNKLKQEGNKSQNVINQLDKWWYGSGYTADNGKIPVCLPKSESKDIAPPSGYPLIYHIAFAFAIAGSILIGLSACCIKKILSSKTL